MKRELYCSRGLVVLVPLLDHSILVNYYKIYYLSIINYSIPDYVFMSNQLCVLFHAPILLSFRYIVRSITSISLIRALFIPIRCCYDLSQNSINRFAKSRRLVFTSSFTD